MYNVSHQPKSIAVREFQPLQPTIESKEVLVRREIKFLSRLRKEGYKGYGHFFRKDGIA